MTLKGIQNFDENGGRINSCKEGLDDAGAFGVEVINMAADTPSPDGQRKEFSMSG